jgi:Tol biopolymer transport system component
MSLTPGARLGPYEIVAAIGAGGMGEVYRAQDTRLNRTVAIKISSAQFSERFEGEARAVAALNHPHICTLHDIGPDYLVMEYIEGQPIQGPMPVDEALKLGVQIADALDAAHRKCIVHRDLKPANILLTKSGVKLLDFGLAKMGQTLDPISDATVTRAITKEGSIIGTLQYMAPEQLQGKEVDARCDIFAFGAVLYELVTGRRAFLGADPASLIASVLTAEPPPLAAESLPPSTRSLGALDRVIRKCLAKDPDARWQTARDLKDELAWLSGSGAVETPSAAAPPKRLDRMAWWIAAAALLAAIPGYILYLNQKPEPARVMRFSVGAPENTEFPEGDYPLVSPDGEAIAFHARTAGQKTHQIWLFHLATGQTSALTGTDDARTCCWSPDSQSLVIWQRDRYRIAAVATGASTPVPEQIRGNLVLGRNDFIFSTPEGIVRVAPDGTGQRQIMTPKKGQNYWPIEFLPDGRQFLYGVTEGQSAISAVIWKGSLDGGAPTPLLTAESPAGFSPPGYLLFSKGGTLMAQPFDAKRGAIQGTATPVINLFPRGDRVVTASFSISRNGVLAYRPFMIGRVSTLAWFDRAGNRLGELGEPADYSNPALSPDGKRLAVGVRDPTTFKREIRILDLVRGTSSRLTFDKSDNLNPVWSPDGSRIFFTSDRKGNRDLYVKSAAGTGEDELLLESGVRMNVEHVSPDGRYLVYNVQDPPKPEQIWMLPLTAPQRTPAGLLTGPYYLDEANFSPDGRWIAYRSRESGNFEVFVQPFPANGKKWQISNSGGMEPQWRGDGKELFYYSGTALMSVEMRSNGGELEAAVPKSLYPVRLGTPGRQRWAVSKDAQKFLILVPEERKAGPFTVVLNWPALLEKK